MEVTPLIALVMITILDVVHKWNFINLLSANTLIVGKIESSLIRRCRELIRRVNERKIWE